MVKQFNELDFLLDQLKLGSRAEVSFQRFSPEQMGYLRDLYDNDGPRMQGRSAQLATLQEALTASEEKFASGDIEKLVPAITRFLTEMAYYF